MRISNWYGEEGQRIEEFATSTGETLYDKDVQKLMDAMAAFDPPLDDTIHLYSQDEQQVLDLIAVTWQ